MQPQHRYHHIPELIREAQRRGTMKKSAVLAVLALLAVIVRTPAQAADVICYNCPPQWADFASMLKAIKTDLGYDIPFDNKNSGQALSQLLAEKANPVAYVVYYGVNFGMKAKGLDVIETYKPKGWAEVPAGLKDADGAWTTIHSGTLGLFVNKDALGGSESDFSPAVTFFKDLHKNQPIVPKQTSYARVVSGEIPILFDYDFNAYRAKYTEKGTFEFVIPCAATVIFPYVVTLVKNAPDKDKAKKVLDYLLSDKGQAIWTNAYLRPARPIELPAAIKAKFLPDSDYARAKSVDWAKMEAVQKGFTDRYLAEVR